MGDMEFSMPVDVQTYDKKDVDDLFVDLVRRLSITGVDAYVNESETHDSCSNSSSTEAMLAFGVFEKHGSTTEA